MNPLTFRALAEPNRFHIIEILRDKPQPVGEIAARLHIRQPQASKHLKILADAGIVDVHPQANQRIYELSPKKFQEIDSWLEKYRALWNQRLEALEKVLQHEQYKMKGGEK
jgi:DNA-binding transcriptional ArsR family regulator